MQKEYQLAVDIEKKILTPSFEVNTLDLKTIKLKITITKGMTLVDLTDIAVRMSIRKPDGNVIFQDCQITNAKGGQVEIILENQAYIMPGSYSAEIMCFKGTDKVAVTGSFSYRSIRGIMDDKAVESKSEFTAITKQLDNVQATVNDLRENGTGIDAQARQGVEQVTEQLVDIENEKIDFINIKKYSRLVTGGDWTQAIQKAITDVAWGGTIYFPIGTYEHKGINVTISCNFRGHSKTSTILRNTGNGDSFTILKDVERGTFSNIGIFGNATGSYGEGATAKKGFVFKNNSVCWNFDNIWMRDHGDHFFYASGQGNVNNINISNSEFERGGKSTFYFVQTDVANQINGISVRNCNISGFNENGFVLWGQSITVDSNTVQACKGRGIVIDALIGANGSSAHATGIRLINNYFELCNLGFIYIQAHTVPHIRYINGVIVEKNFGDYGVIPGTSVDFDNVHVVEVKAPEFYSFNNNQISGFVYKGNSFGTGGKAKSILNANNVLSYDSMVHKVFPSTYNNNSESKFINLGRAKILSNTDTRKTIKGLTSCFSHTYNVEKSPNISTTGTLLKYDLAASTDMKIKSISFPIDTDSQNYRITLAINHRNRNTLDQFVREPLYSVTSLVGKQVISYDVIRQMSPLLEKDYFFDIQVNFNDNSNTYFYVGNIEVGLYE